MNGFEGILFAAILLAFLAGVFALIYKGSRPPQPVPIAPTTSAAEKFDCSYLLCRSVLSDVMGGDNVGASCLRLPPGQPGLDPLRVPGTSHGKFREGGPPHALRLADCELEPNRAVLLRTRGPSA